MLRHHNEFDEKDKYVNKLKIFSLAGVSAFGSGMYLKNSSIYVIEGTWI